MPTLTPVYAPRRRPGRVHIGAVSEETITEIDEAWEYLQKHPNLAIRVEFDSVKEAKRWKKEARTYCETFNPPLRFRQERSEKFADASDLVCYFRLTVVEEDE